MKIDWSSVGSPFVDLDPEVSRRDPALALVDGVFRCFHTAVEYWLGSFMLFVDVTESHNLIEWSEPMRLTQDELNFSSPGNVLRVGDTWRMCVQSYPLPSTAPHAGNDARLWLLESTDLIEWSAPKPIVAAGCRAAWAKTPRQIDPYLVEHDGRYWCFYKTDGCLGLLVSDDMVHWAEASPDRPVLAATDTPDGSTVENPCVVHNGKEFVLFFAPCRGGRGIGVARSEDLLTWRDVRYLDFPSTAAWAKGGPTAPMVLDLRDKCGRWLMAYHGERKPPHGGALGLAWSEDMEHWECGPALTDTAGTTYIWS